MIVLSMANKKKALTAAEMGARGGKKRAANLSKRKLTQIGKAGAEARWGKPKRKKRAK